MKELVCHVTVHPTDTLIEYIWGSTVYCHYSHSVMLYVFFPRLPAFYPEAAYMLCECALHKPNRDETIRERGCFTVSFRHILDLIFISILTTSLFDRRQRMSWRPEMNSLESDMNVCLRVLRAKD